jgi:hypothetical protein
MVGDVGMRRTISDYHSILVNAISGLEKGSAEAREELYEQARAALIADFNRLDPAPSELDVLEERFELNLAIHDFEFSSATGLNAESEAMRPPIPTESGHPFRSKAATDSEAMRPLC